MLFEFGLETVLRIRSHEENEQMRIYGDHVRTTEALKSTQGNVRNQLQTLADQHRTLAGGTKNIRSHYAYLHDLHQQDHELDGEIRKAKEAAEKERLKLVEANKKTKVLEKLKERQRLEFIKELERKEQLEQNEMATIRYNYNRR